jgi:hypothetical protein
MAKRKPSKLGKVLRKKAGPQKKCASDSLRAVMPRGRPDVRIIICCPPDEWAKRKKKCKVSLRKHATKYYRKKRTA